MSALANPPFNLYEARSMDICRPPVTHEEPGTSSILELSFIPAQNTPPRSILEQLPLELLLEIESYINSTEDLLALRAACKKTCAVFKTEENEPPNVIIAPDSARAHNLFKRMKWDKMCRQVDAEKAQPNSRFCGPCEGLHPKTAFSETQLHVDPWSRVCQGRERIYRVCVNSWKDFIEMRRIGRDDSEEHCIHRECDPHFLCPEYESEGTVITNVKRLDPKGADVPEYVHSFESPIPGVQSATRLSEKWPHDRLGHDTTRICQHLRVCDLNTAALRVEVGSDDGSEKLRGMCESLHCRMEFSLEWKYSHDGLEWKVDGHDWISEKVYVPTLKTQRKFKFESPADPAWLANSEPVMWEAISKSQFREDFFSAW